MLLLQRLKCQNVNSTDKYSILIDNNDHYTENIDKKYNLHIHKDDSDDKFETIIKMTFCLRRIQKTSTEMTVITKYQTVAE